MFKHNFIQKLAFDNIKRQKRFYKFIFSSLVLIFALSSMISILLVSYEEVGYRERCANYGKWSVAFSNPSEKDLKGLKDNQKIEVGFLYNVGDLSYNNHNVGAIHSLDSKALELSSLTLLQGRYPQNKKEIIIEEERFLSLNIPEKINQDIELKISEEKSETYKIVGIVKNYTNIYPLSISSFITTGYTSSENVAMLYNDDNLVVWNYIGENNLESKVQLNNLTYQDYFQEQYGSAYSKRDGTIMFRWFVIVIGFTAILGTMVSTISKRTDNFILMKSIGATSKQITKLILYEGVFLTIMAGVIGVSIGLIISLITLISYALIADSYFIFIVNPIFYTQIAISFVIAIIGIYIPTLTIAKIPLVEQFKHKTKFSKKRKIRKTNVCILAIREITEHKIISIVLVGIIFVGIMSGDLLTGSIESYVLSLQDLNKSENFDYALNVYNQNITQNDIESLINIKGTTSQAVHVQRSPMTWDGIEEEKRAINHRKQSFPSLDSSILCQKMNVSYYENQQMIKDIFDKYMLSGRFPQEMNEVIIVKPWIEYYENGNGASVSTSKGELKNPISDVGLEVGDYIYMYRFDNDIINKVETPFQIVGVISFEKNVNRKEEEQLLISADYNLITTATTYNQFFNKDEEQCLYFDVDDLDSKFALKKEIYDVMDNVEDRSSVRYSDYQSDQQMFKIRQFQFMLSTVSFSGITFIGIMILTYLYRKVKILSSRHEIGLYRAIGMTNKQFLGVHLIYGILIYIASVIAYILLLLRGYLKTDYSLMNALKEIVTPSMFIFFITLAFGFILAVMLPVFNELKENILETITKE